MEELPTEEAEEESNTPYSLVLTVDHSPPLSAYVVYTRKPLSILNRSHTSRLFVFHINPTNVLRDKLAATMPHVQLPATEPQALYGAISFSVNGTRYQKTFLLPQPAVAAAADFVAATVRAARVCYANIQWKIKTQHATASISWSFGATEREASGGTPDSYIPDIAAI